MKNIEADDTVKVIFTRNNIFDWQNSCMIDNCLVIKTPNGTGDNWGLEYYSPILSPCTKRFYVNPNCSEFIGMELIKRGKNE